MNGEQSAHPLIPITVLTGFLGSGKTTLLNHLVQQPAMARTLVIINEFGEMSLDHLLVAHSTDDIVMEMSSGCLCCTIRGDLVKTLRDITWRFARNAQKQFDRVLIETTGLADPAPIIHTLMTDHALVEHYRLDGIVATVDMATANQTLDRHVEAVKQVAMSDCLLLTKRDLVGEEDGRLLEERLAAINPSASRHRVDFGVLDAGRLLNLGLYRADEKPEQVADWLREEAYASRDGSHHHAHHHEHKHDHAHHGHDAHGDHHAHRHGHGHDHDDHHHHHHHDVNRHDDHIRAFCFSVDDPIPEDGFNAWLELLMSLVGERILRVKGILNVVGSEQPVVIHGVQHIFHPPATLPAWPDDDRRSRMVFITQDVGREMIEKTFHAFMPPAPAAT